MEANRFYVYTYSYPTGEHFYVGKGTGTRDKRHLRDAKTLDKAVSWCQKVIKSILKKGKEPIIKRLIDKVDNELACFIEQEYIAKHGRKDLGTGILVNCTDGGDGGHGFSKETKKKLSDKLKAVTCATRFTTGFIPWNKGGHHTEEAKEKNRQSKLGQTLSVESRKKLSESLKKVECATRFKKGMVALNKGVPALPHVMEAVRKANLGRVQSQEEKDKRAKSLMGHKTSQIVIDRIVAINNACDIKCPHCNKTGNLGSMARWHMNNCKFKEAN
jgi:hypothetical protein